ncbi:unnamed protein product, partial [Ectocarpus sp. 12 AP-2014]
MRRAQTHCSSSGTPTFMRTKLAAGTQLTHSRRHGRCSIYQHLRYSSNSRLSIWTRLWETTHTNPCGRMYDMDSHPSQAENMKTFYAGRKGQNIPASNPSLAVTQRCMLSLQPAN